MSPYSPPKEPNHRLVWFLLFPLFLLAAVYPPRIHGYLNPYDEGLWLGAAQDLLAGKVLYRDAFFHYGPILGMTLQAALHLMTPTLSSLRMLFWIMNAAGLLVIYCCVIRWVRTISLRVSAALFLWIVPLTAPSLTMPTAIRYGASFLPFLFWPREKEESRRTNLLAFLSGAGAVAALFISQEVGLASLVATAYYFYVLFPDSRRKYWALSGGFLISVLVLGWLASNQGIRAYVDCSFFQTPSIVFHDRLPLPSPFVRSWREVGPWFRPWRQLAIALAIYFPALSLILFFVIRRRSRMLSEWTDPVLTAFAIYAGLTATSAWVRSDQWHIYFALSPALFFWAVWSDRQVPHFKPYATLAMIGISTLITLPQAIARQYKDRALSVISRTTNLDRAGSSRLPAEQATGYEFLVGWIKQHVKKGEPFLFYPYDGTIYFLADSPNPTYYSVLALATTLAMRNRVVSDLRTQKPHWVVWDTENTAFDRVPIKTFMGPIHQYILEQYRIKGRTGPFLFLERMDVRA